MQRQPALLLWVLTTIILWTYAALSALMTVVAIRWAVQTAEGSTEISRAASIAENAGSSDTMALLLGTAASSMVIALFCVFAWHLMRRRTQLSFELATILIAVAFGITVFRWFCEYRRLDFNYGSWIEPVFIWPPLVYVIIFAYQRSRTV